MFQQKSDRLIVAILIHSFGKLVPSGNFWGVNLIGFQQASGPRTIVLTIVRLCFAPHPPPPQNAQLPPQNIVNITEYK